MRERRLLIEILQKPLGFRTTPWSGRQKRASHSVRFKTMVRAAGPIWKIEAAAKDRDVGTGGWALVYLAVGDPRRALEQLEAAAVKVRNHELICTSPVRSNYDPHSMVAGVRFGTLRLIFDLAASPALSNLPPKESDLQKRPDHTWQCISRPATVSSAIETLFTLAWSKPRLTARSADRAFT